MIIIKMNVHAKALTEYSASSKEIAKKAETINPIASNSRII